MEPKVITADQYRLTTCGVPVPPDALVLDVPTWFIFSDSVAASSTRPDLKQALHPQYDFYLRSISSRPASADEGNLRIRIGRPDGKWLSNARERLFLSYGFGSTRRSVLPGIRCGPGTRLTIDVENPVAALNPFTLMFGGVTRFYLTANRGANGESA